MTSHLPHSFCCSHEYCGLPGTGTSLHCGDGVGGVGGVGGLVVHPVHAWHDRQQKPIKKLSLHLPHPACCSHVYCPSGATSLQLQVSFGGVPPIETATKGLLFNDSSAGKMSTSPSTLSDVHEFIAQSQAPC